jgi:Ubiquitin family
MTRQNDYAEYGGSSSLISSTTCDSSSTAAARTPLLVRHLIGVCQTMSKMYQKLEVDEETGDTQNVKDAASNKGNINMESGLDVGQPGETFSVKILLKEANLQLPSLTERTTVGELKVEIEKITNITPKYQRLIFAGKQLKLDDLTLRGCNIVANSSIHLFPFPMKPAVENSTEEGTTTASATSNTVTTFAIIPRESNEPFTHSDPEISQHCREVHLWSIILVFLSGLTLWNNITYTLAKGQFGESALDSSVTILNTVMHNT